jgi:hypothetical protein
MRSACEDAGQEHAGQAAAEQTHDFHEAVPDGLRFDRRQVSG